ncbi:MAG TPA: hypothetical protein PKD64_09755 [Pirellulaceae bacterium]|nr:hypothetical protein [Pirellulaceae bacterium]HMO92470.1 hypothetical protein [Pirellulaceae bacterium]HMP67860.1 hypothetical protein [Pirellulaceae bacterium]
MSAVIDVVESQSVFTFANHCRLCDHCNQFSIYYLGREVRCRKCFGTYLAIDRELQSAALEEDIGHVAKLCAAPDSKHEFLIRPR